MESYYVVLTTHDGREACIQVWAPDEDTAETIAYAMVRGGYAGIESVHSAKEWNPSQLRKI